MTVRNRPVIGYVACPHGCGNDRATVHQQASGAPFLYTRCIGGCGKACQSKKPEIQEAIYKGMERLPEADIKEPPFLHKQKQQEPSVNQGSGGSGEWVPPEEKPVIQETPPAQQTSDKPSGGAGLAVGLTLLVGSLFVIVRGV